MWAWVAGLLAACIAMVASGALVYQHLSGRSLPGCGGGTQQTGGLDISVGGAPVSACASLEAHWLGSLGGHAQAIRAVRAGQPIGAISMQNAFWPTSFTGTAYFAGVVAAWLVIGATGRRLAGLVRGGLWLGLGLSLVFLVVISLDKKFCQYCITAHASNLLLVVITEIGMFQARLRRDALVQTTGTAVNQPSHTARPAWLGPVVAGLTASVLSAGAMGMLESRKTSGAAAEASEAFRQTQADLAKKAAEDAARAISAQKDQTERPFNAEGFKARWTLGPAKAPVRIVIISSYQCPDCRIIEAEALELIDKHKGKISLGAMHFPLSKDCNKYVPTANLHPNGCWAARVAETAGLLKGADGFWKTHKWLFEIRGTFDDNSLKAGIKQLGFEEASFLAILGTDASLRPVQADIDVGERLGLYFTPMIFVNGVEVRGWLTQPRALTAAVEAVLATNPPAVGPENDQPALAATKYLDDWRLAQKRSLGEVRAERSLGKSDALVRVVVFGDYAEPNTKDVTSMLVEWARKSEKPIRVTYRYFPGDKTCNTGLPRTFFENGCLAARAAEAAGITAGPEGFWKMHDWLFAFPDKTKLTEGAILDAAATLGLEPGKLRQAMNAGPAGVAIDNDIALARGAGVTQIPAIYINDRFVQRWTRENDNVIERIVDAAAQGK
jgi:protein-disulfide isomerase